ncbi:MAG: sulfotransferase family protein [Proteobacteria bacterium]|nr:sulfotransferase family protein [Pseudomonadota bacterium]
MISHELSTIFVHVPRTGGSSIETALVGGDWWGMERRTKHIDWRNAKRLYSKYWKKYFKFAVVRNPWDWMVSLYHSHKNQRSNRFGEKTWEEYLRKPNLAVHEQKTMIQSNIVGKELDYIVKYDNLESGFEYICDRLKVKKGLEHIARSDHRHYAEYYDDEKRRLVENRYIKDIKRFGWEF